MMRTFDVRRSVALLILLLGLGESICRAEDCERS